MVRQGLFISIISSWGSGSLSVYCDCNNGFYYYFLYSPLSQVLKTKIQEKQKTKPKKPHQENIQSFPIYLRVSVDVLSLTCSFNLFATAMFCENTRDKLAEKGKNMGSSAKKAKDSTLQSSRTDILKPDSRIESPKELKRNNIKNYTHVQPTLTTSHSSNYILLFCLNLLSFSWLKLKLS